MLDLGGSVTAEASCQERKKAQAEEPSPFCLPTSRHFAYSCTSFFLLELEEAEDQGDGCRGDRGACEVDAEPAEVDPVDTSRFASLSDMVGKKRHALSTICAVVHSGPNRHRAPVSVRNNPIGRGGTSSIGIVFYAQVQ